MSEFYCSICKYTSNRKDFVKNHINRKTKCGNGIAQLIEIPSKICCKHCNKNFTTKRNLERHENYNCRVSLNDIKKANQTIKELQEKLELAEKKLESAITPNQTINIDNSVNNIIVVLNGYNETDVSKLTDKHFIKAINKMCLSVPTLIKDVHFNPMIPENQNIYISNLRNGYVMVYNADTKNWDARPKGEIIDKLINDREYDIQEWLGEGEKYPKAMEKFNEYLDKKEDDGVQKMIKDEIELLLYNNRTMITNKK